MNHSVATSPGNLGSVPQILFLILIGVLTSVGAPPPSLATSPPPPPLPKIKCSFNGEEYEMGKTWYRHLKTPTANFCVNCLCKDDGNVNCSTVNCSANMCPGTDDNECCKTCQVPEISHQGGVSAAKGNPTWTPASSCSYNGHLYEDGQSFTSNNTASEAQQPNQCIQCMCQNGLVLCKPKNCSNTRCPLPNSDDCCASCEEKATTSNQQILMDSSSVMIVTGGGNARNGDCVTAGISYSHGSSWHPVIGPFGPMDCVFCKCQNGRIECKRLNCSAQNGSSCSKHVQVPGQCCPVCIEEAPVHRVSSSDSPGVGVTHRQHSPTVTMEQKGNTNHKERPYRGDATVSDCMPQQTDTVVYRSHASSRTSGYYQYAFLSLGKNRNTRLLTWTIKDGQIGDFSEQHLSRSEFDILTRTFKFKIQGATRTKFVEKFARKAKRLPNRCNNRCTAKIQRLEQALHLQEITRKPNCDSDGIFF